MEKAVLAAVSALSHYLAVAISTPFGLIGSEDSWLPEAKVPARLVPRALQRLPKACLLLPRGE